MSTLYISYVWVCGAPSFWNTSTSVNPIAKPLQCRVATDTEAAVCSEPSGWNRKRMLAVASFWNILKSPEMKPRWLMLVMSVMLMMLFLHRTHFDAVEISLKTADTGPRNLSRHLSQLAPRCVCRALRRSLLRTKSPARFSRLFTCQDPPNGDR